MTLKYDFIDAEYAAHTAADSAADAPTATQMFAFARGVQTRVL